MENGKVQVVSDNVILRDDGTLMLIESMFSGVHDLSTDTGELLGRIHPVKRQLYDRVVGGEVLETTAQLNYGRSVHARIHSSIEIHVNGPQGGIEVLDYAALARRATSSVSGETQARGFDAAGEPVIRQMRDRSFRLVFLSMPPQQHALGKKFDIDHFGAALIRSSKASISWDDRDVFHISQGASADDLRALLRFLATYRGKP